MQQQVIPKLLATRKEAARALRGSTRLVDELTRSGVLVPVRIGSRVLFAWAELERLVKQRTRTSKSEHLGGARKRMSA